MKLEIGQVTIEQNQHMMKEYGTLNNILIVKARVESQELVDDKYSWVAYDIDQKGNYIEGTVEVLDRELTFDDSPNKYLNQ